VSRGLRSRSRTAGGCLPGRGHCPAGAPIAGLLSRGRERDLPGSQAIGPVPLPRSTAPAESTILRLMSVSSMLPPWLYRGYRGASAPVAYASRMVLAPSLQGLPPAGWLAFTARELNPLDRDEGFQITLSSSSLDFSWRNVRKPSERRPSSHQQVRCHAANDAVVLDGPISIKFLYSSRRLNIIIRFYPEEC
jgi:hypothetical protein